MSDRPVVEKRKNQDVEELDDDVESFSDEESDSDSCSSDESIENEKIDQVDTEFEAYPPAPEDQEGIKALLKQLFKKEPVELGQLAEHLINEKKLCLIIKQLIDEEVNEDDEDVFSLSALIELNKLADKPFVQLINKFLIKTAKEQGNKRIAKVLEDANESKALVLNERFINLPPKLGIMSLENLFDEVQNQKLQINYFIFISKLLRAKNESSVKKENHKRSKSISESELIYLNAEDEVFADHALAKYEFKIADDDSDLSVQQNWRSGQKYMPFRRVLLLDQQGLIDSLKSYKENQNNEEAN